MSWNIAFDKVMEIKKAFIDKFGADLLWDYDKEKTHCLEYWTKMLDVEEYNNIIKCLLFTEYNDLLLIRYGRTYNVSDDPEFYKKYDFWDLYDGIFMECRSLVINIKENEMVLTPFRKFRNVNECEENKIENIRKRIKNASSIEFSNKLDGSMQSARWYKGEVILAGSRALDTNASFRLVEGYKMIAENDGYTNFLKDYKNSTGIFEFISLKDAHVVKYTKEQEGLYLIGIRDVDTGYEHPYSEVMKVATKYGLPTTSMYQVTFDEIMNSLDDKKSCDAEGFVMNIDGYKVKIKYNDYVNMHTIFSELSSPNLVIRNIADDKWDDFISKCPESCKHNVLRHAQNVYTYIDKFDNGINMYYDSIMSKNPTAKKDFMLLVQQTVPKVYRPYIINKYLQHPYNILKSKNNHYVSMKEIMDYLEQCN